MANIKTIAIEETECYHSPVHLKLSDLLPIHKYYDPLPSGYPLFRSTYSAGSYIFVRKFDGTFQRKNLMFDELRPWSKNGNKLKTKVVEFNGSKYVHRYISHPHIKGLMKLVLISDNHATICYNFGTTIDSPADLAAGRKETDPVILDSVKKELNFRSVKNVGKIMKLQNQPVPQRVIRNISRRVDTCVKSNTGPISPLDPAELLDMLAPHNYRVHFEGQSVDSKPQIMATVVFDKALKFYAADCPSFDQLCHFKAFMSEAIDEDNLPRPQEFNNSMFIPGMETQLSIDTTFDLSNLYVTLIVGKLASYKTKCSGKDRPLLLALMLHTAKTAAAHRFFGEFFAETWKRLTECKGKSIPSIIRDGEPALAEITKDRIFSDAVHLRCDLHLCHNLLGHRGLANADAKVLFGVAVGTKIKNGLLQQTSEEGFYSYLNKMATKYPQLYKKTIRRAADIFEYNSRRAKLIAGFGGRYGTTNSTEGFNEMTKNSVGRKKMSGHMLMESLLEMHKEQMEELQEAQEGISENVEYLPRIPFLWPPMMNNNSTAVQDSTITSSLSSDSSAASAVQDNTVTSSLSSDSEASAASEKNYGRANKKKPGKFGKFKQLQKIHMKHGDGSKRKGKSYSKGNFKRICYESLQQRAIDTTAEDFDRSSCPPQPIPTDDDEEILPLSYLRRSLSWSSLAQEMEE